MKIYFFLTGIFWVFLCLFYSLSLNQKNIKVFILGIIVFTVFITYKYYYYKFSSVFKVLIKNILMFFSIVINTSTLILLFFILINLVNTTKSKNDLFANKNIKKEIENFYLLDGFLNEFENKFYYGIKNETDLLKTLNELDKICKVSKNERKNIINFVINNKTTNPLLNDMNYDKILNINDLKLSPIKIKSDMLLEVYKLELFDLSERLKTKKNPFIIREYLLLWLSLEKLLKQNNTTISNFILYLKIGDVLTEFYFDHYYYFKRTNINIDFKAINGYYQFSFENSIKYEYHIFNTLLNMFKTKEDKVIYWPIINYNYELSKQNEYLYHELISFGLPIYEYKENTLMQNFIKMKFVSPASYTIIKSIARPDFVSLKIEIEMLKNKLNLMNNLIEQKNKFKTENIPYDRLTGVPFIFRENDNLLIIESIFKKNEFKCVIIMK